ncbi:Kelch-like protein 21 [Ilyonectria robusta]
MISTRTAEQIAKLRENGEFTDFEFTCNGHTIPVHRVVICSQSPVFHAACNGEFKEASTRTYSLDSHSLPMVRRMMDFFYTGDYTEESEEEDTGEDAIPVLSVHAAMFALTDKHNIEDLTVLSAKKYSENLTKNPDVSNFLYSISEVYNSTLTSSRGLRDRALAFARAKLPGFLTLSDAKEEFDEVTADTPEFIKELLYSFIRYPLMGHCSNCGTDKQIPTGCTS